MTGFYDNSGTVDLNRQPTVNTQTAEAAKDILENLDSIFKEMEFQLTAIDCAIFGPERGNEPKPEPQDECMLGTLNRQRNTAEKLLKTIAHIREGLW